MSRAPLTSASTVGSQAPRSDPYTDAAVWALAQAKRVAGLFRSPRSTISASVRLRMRPARSEGTAARVDVSAASMRGMASAGGVHGISGRGEAPRTPETLGVPAHPARRSAEVTAASLTDPTP